MRKLFIVLGVSFALGGCVTTAPTVSETAVINELNTKTYVTSLSELKQISIEARDEMRLLAKAKEEKNKKALTRQQHEQKYFQATHVPEAFEKVVSFKYTNRAHKVASAIAQLAGYKIKIEGKKIMNEPWVSINLNNRPLNDALKELGVQTGDVIRIEVHEKAKLIRFIYKNGMDK